MTTPVLGEWIQFDLGTAKVIQTYGLGNGGADKEIGNWTLAGSTDNTTWYTIDTRTEATPAHDDFNTYTSAGPAAAGSFRYIRLIVQGLTQQPYIMGSTLEFILYLQDSSGNFLQTSPTNTATFSENLGNTTGSFRLSTSASDHYPWNEVGAGPSGPGYYYGTNDTYTGTVSTSITSGAPGGGITASSFGDVQLSLLSQIILSADEQHYIIANPGNYRAIQINLDGTSLSELFSLDTSLFPFSSNEYMSGITYNPSKTKFIIVFGGSTSYPTSNNYVVEVDLDGTNPVVKMNDSTVFAGTSEQALQCPQCITLTADQQFYLITMYAGYAGDLWRIIKVPVNDMSNPTVFATNEMFNSSVTPQQLAYTPDGNFIFPGYDGNSIYTMNSDGTNVALLYTAADIGISLLWGPSGMLQTADGTGYLITAYDSNGIKFLPMGSSPAPATAPTAPTSLSATISSGNVSISFTQGSDGGSAITNYKYSLNGGSTFTAFDPADTTSPVVIGGLTNGVAYNIQLKAVNSIGDSDASATVYPPPTTTAALGETATFDLGAAYQLGSYGYCAGSYPNSLQPTAWKMAGSNDNSTWYLVDSISNGNSGSGDARSFTPSGPSRVSSFRYYRWILQQSGDHVGNTYFGGFFLKNTSGSVITATVIQNNIASYYGGYLKLDLMINRTSFIGGATDTLYPSYRPGYTGSNSTTLIIDAPPSAPPAPTSLAASAGNESASITFTQGSDGGFDIENYLYSLNGGTFTAFNPVDTTSPVVIGGLTNGVAYTIQLKGVNSLGEGDASASISVTPATIPDAPTNLVATYAGSGAVDISFTPGSNGGSTITNYQYSINCGATFTPLNPVDGITPVRIEGLTNGQAYCIELKAVNSVNAGIASSSVQYTPYGPANAPTNLTWVDTLNGTISLSFTPGSNQGSAITNYEYSLDGGSTFAAFSPAQATSPVSITGLNIRTHYSIVLRAVNDAGAGENSATLNMYYLCFLEGTKILCFNPETNQEEYRAIETLRKGSLVKTVDDGYKAVDTIGTSKIYNPGNSVRSKNRLYKCSKENYPSLTEDLFITGCHSILVKDISEEERAELMDYQGKIYITDQHYRLIAAVDKRAEPHASEGVFNIWHMALENDNYYFNYGIYANGLLVETSSLRMMKEFSGMDLVQ
jgi:hypothetical protein